MSEKGNTKLDQVFRELGLTMSDEDSPPGLSDTDSSSPGLEIIEEPEPVSEIPDMLRLGPWNRNQRLARQRMRPVKAMMQNGYPVFWRLDL